MIYQQLLFYGNNYESILYCNISYYVLYILVDVLYYISFVFLISLLSIFDSNSIPDFPYYIIIHNIILKCLYIKNLNI